jgi:hypothetical protein
LAFAVGASATPLWVLLFPTHTVINSWLNVRLLILPVSLGFAALAWQLTAPHRRRDGLDATRIHAPHGPGSRAGGVEPDRCRSARG